jgi:hypothetical protein
MTGARSWQRCRAACLAAAVMSSPVAAGEAQYGSPYQRGADARYCGRRSEKSFVTSLVGSSGLISIGERLLDAELVVEQRDACACRPTA